MNEERIEYKSILKLLHINNFFIILIIFWDLFALNTTPTIKYFSWKFFFIFSSYVALCLLKFNPLKNWATAAITINYFFYSYYFMINVHYSYYIAFIQVSLALVSFLKFKKVQFFISYTIGLALLMHASTQVQNILSFPNFQSDVVSTYIPVWIFSIIWFFKVKKEQERLATSEAKFTELGKRSSFLIHELKAPISRLSFDSNSTPKMEQEVENIRNLLILTDQISSHDARENIQLEEVNIKAILKEILSHYENDIDILNIALLTELDTISTETSRSLISVIFKNCIKNALEYHYENKEINDKTLTVSLIEKNAHVHIQIKNNIRNLTAKSIKQFLEPHYTTKKNISNRGLGLYITNKISNILNISFDCLIEKNEFIVDLKIKRPN